uniref:Nudix hydrolase domain-containing protein n=1 Tax=Parascaris univalens TaxID=6257 RepID=A0A914ZNP4_PARUN
VHSILSSHIRSWNSCRRCSPRCFLAMDSPLQNQTTGSVPSLVANRSSPTSAFFKPLSASSHPMSFTGASFLQL